MLRFEHEEVHLVCVLVHHRRPGEPAGVEQAAVQPDVARGRARRAVRADMDRHLPRDDVPVERACLERGPHLRVLAGRTAVEDVVASAGERAAGQAQGEQRDEEEEAPQHRASVVGRTGLRRDSRSGSTWRPFGVVALTRFGDGLAQDGGRSTAN